MAFKVTISFNNLFQLMDGMYEQLKAYFNEMTEK